MNIQNNGINSNKLSFSGHKKSVDKTGYVKHDFYYLYDTNKYNCELELFNIEKDKKGNLSISEKAEPAVTKPMNNGSVTLDMSEVPEIYSEDGFAYRFKLTDKNSNEVSYAFDNGTVIGIFDKNNRNNKFNVILNNRATINKNGPMQLIMPDFYYPGVIGKDGKPSIDEALRAKALASVRTHANKLGGNFYGIIQRLPKLKQEGIKRIVGTPYTKDDVSSHKYWTENAYKISSDYGTEDDFKLFQLELFKNDMNWISDAALVNEGFSGIHMAELLRKGENSFSKNLFRANEKISLGIIPEVSDNTRLKLINAPFSIDYNGVYHSSNKAYDPHKPTYIQFYDENLASDKQKKSNSPSDLKTYENNNTDNIYDITHHDDAVYPFAIEVDPYELNRNAKMISASNNGIIDLSDMEEIKAISDFTNFKVVNKTEAGGIELWDGNVDIPKALFYPSAKDDEKFVKLPPELRAKAYDEFYKGSLAVREYALNSGKYWTKLPYDTILEYAAGKFDGKCKTAEDYLDSIEKMKSKGLLPESVKSIDKEIIQNVLDGNYHSQLLDELDMRSDINPEGFGNDYSLSDFILKRAMDLPLETLPVANNLLGILTSPYISKKPNTEEELGVSRYDISKAGNVNLPSKYSKTYEQVENLFKSDIVPMIENIVSSVPGIQENGMVSDYGKYVLNETVGELTKYIITKSLAPDAEITVKKDGELKGTLDFSKVKEDDITMQSLNIPFNSKTLQEESQMVINAMKKGISEIPEKEIQMLKAQIKERFKGKTLNDFKIAEMIIDQTEAGMGWRIDAAKDIAAMDGVRSGAASMHDEWNNVIDFWKKYNQSVLQINPHSYTTAEITDLAELFRNQGNSVFENDGDAERKFIQETGITTTANYNYFFSLPPELFAAYNFEWGGENENALKSTNIALREKLDTGWNGNPGFLFQTPDDGVKNSYTFVGNHDKPRVLHCLGLNMGLFHSDFSKDEHKQAALKCLYPKGDVPENVDYSKIKPAAIAMGTRINECIDEVVNDDKSKLKAALKRAVSQLAAGTFKDKDFDAAAFGTRPFEVALNSVFEQAEFNGFKIPHQEKLKAEILKEMLEPAMDRYLSMYKLLTVLPGSPTDFAGDRVGATGYETKAKNYLQQNRNTIHWEWLNENSPLRNNDYNFIRNFYNKMNEIALLRQNEKLSALNDGDTVTLPVIKANWKESDPNPSLNKYLQAILRYNDKGSVVITLHDLSGTQTPFNKKMERGKTSTDTYYKHIYDKIILDTKSPLTTSNQGLVHGLTENTVFRNNRADDTNTYEIKKITDENGKEYYSLQTTDGSPITIEPEDLNTLILYKE